MILSVIIVSYKNIDILRDCLNSIKQYNDIGDDLEVIVSDNSTDMVLYETIKTEYDWVKIVKNENKGFGAGNNRGYEISSGKYLLFLNPDTILIEPVFDFAIKQFEKESNLALFGVQLLDKLRNENCSFFMIDKYGIVSTLYIKICRKLNHFKDGKMFIHGADLFVRRESFEQAGKFDEKIFMYKEESDLIKRIKLYSHAKGTVFFSQKKIIHLEGGTEDKNDETVITVRKRLIESDRYYSEKWKLDFRKILKEKNRYLQLKYYILKLIHKKKRAEKVKLEIDLLKREIKGAKECKN